MRRWNALFVLLALGSAACSSTPGGSTGARATCSAITLPTRAPAAPAAPAGKAGEITVYSGRSEKLVGPIVARFQQATGIKVNARYGDTAELAATLQEEGARSPADVFFSQDAGALGALQQKGRFATLPQPLVDRVPAAYRSTQGKWVGISGRVRVIAYNCEKLRDEDVPDSVFDLTDAKWRGQIGWAPTNGSFQIFITAMRKLRGDAETTRWLTGMKTNDAKVFPNNDSIAEAIASGEIQVGLVNHYYPFEMREEIPDAKVAAHFLAGGDPGGLVNVAGAGILASSKRTQLAQRFIEFLLSDEGQKYFVERTFEYPLVRGLKPFEGLPALESLQPPAVDLSDLADLEGTLELLKAVGLL